jgi:S1-C subfamily serine protease
VVGLHARARIAAIAALLAVAAASAAAADNGISASVIRIVNQSQRGNWFAPWDAPASQQSSGSGFAIAGGILTNAHVASDSRLLLIYLQGDPTPYQARVRFIAHDCDLALIEPVDPKLLARVPKLALGGLPELGSTVETYGYPSGGQLLSSTRGVVSRIEMNLYSHSGIDQHLTVQTDAAINPGNSGGPVIQRGKVVGVAFQAAAQLENVGFFIPIEVVTHFLDDIRDGRYDGYPELGVSTSNLENPAARAKAGMQPGESGVMVDFVFPESSGDPLVQPGDVLLTVDGRRVANDGSVPVAGVLLDFGVLIDRHQSGDTARLRVLRGGERLDLAIPMKPYRPIQRFANLYDVEPRYFVYAGLVFEPLDRELVATLGDEWSNRTEAHLGYEYLHRYLVEPERLLREVVVLVRRLTHPVNAQMAYYRYMLVENVNGRPIRSLEDLIAALDENRDRYHVFDFGYFGRFGVIDREAADAANAEILELYGVPEDRRL